MAQGGLCHWKKGSTAPVDIELVLWQLLWIQCGRLYSRAFCMKRLPMTSGFRFIPLSFCLGLALSIGIRRCSR